MLDFELRPAGPRRNWRNALTRNRYQAILRQRREPRTTANVGRELVEALSRTIRNQISSDSTMTPNSTVYFSLQSDAFSHAFQSTTFTVAEFEDDSVRLDTYLHSLAAKLTSNQEFSLDDSFTVETTFVHTPGTGSGNGKKQRPGREAMEKLLARKQSVVTIKNRFELCCARAIVTMKVRADEGPRGPNLCGSIFFLQ